jgi:predicted nucleic acid-binding protein
MFVLDTCFISEFARKVPNTGVVAWIGQQSETDLLITTITLGEVAKGIELLPIGPKRSSLEIWYANDLMQRFNGRIQSFDEAAAFEWGRLSARLALSGTPMPAIDSQIAAICLLRGAALVTRNVADFARSGVTIVNPWV